MSCGLHSTVVVGVTLAALGLAVDLACGQSTPPGSCDGIQCEVAMGQEIGISGAIGRRSGCSAT
jgi:hypothetical protein